MKNSTTVIKKIRHQPYVVKSHKSNDNNHSNKESNTIKNHFSNHNNKTSNSSSSSSNSSKYDYIPHSALNPNTNDECWPFLCSLNV